MKKAYKAGIRGSIAFLLKEDYPYFLRQKRGAQGYRSHQKNLTKPNLFSEPY